MTGSDDGQVHPILLTVGAQMPFDRLVSAVDNWAVENVNVSIIAQVGKTGAVTRNIRTVGIFTPDELRRQIQNSQLVVSHAGMGTIITCLELRRPLVIMPRRGDLRETRNDHQLATAARFSSRPGIWVATSEAQLRELLDRRHELTSVGQPPMASQRLLNAIRKVFDD